MWIIFALGASLFWGISYVIAGEIYKKISVFTSLGITFLFVSIVTLIVSYSSGHFNLDISAITSSKKLLWYIIAGMITLFIAELFIGFSISTKSATLAGLVEISYPIFIAVFSYFLLKEKITIPTFIGGIIVFLGIFIVYYFNR